MWDDRGKNGEKLSDKTDLCPLVAGGCGSRRIAGIDDETHSLRTVRT
jgi:hypothetical protein